MPRFAMTFLIVLLLSVFYNCSTARARIVQVSSSNPWCDTINAAVPGDEVVLLNTANFTSTCVISVRGATTSPITIRSQSTSQRATFTYSGTTANVIEFQNATYVIFKWMAFSGMQDGVDAIRIRSGNNLTIDNNTFTNTGGLCVVANDSSTQNITITNNVGTNLKATGFYIGCQDGVKCASTGLQFIGNFVDGVTTPFDPSAVGYALEVKLNSSGAVIRDNTIYRTKGPGIAIYGSNNGGATNLVEGNYVEGSLNDGGIAILGGPAIVRNNVVVGNAYGGISAQNYNNRGLQQNVWIVHNTALNNKDSGINVQSWVAGAGNVLAFNAVLPLSGAAALRPSAPTGAVSGNLTCGASCFVNAASAPYDLWPTSSSALTDAAGSGSEAWRPTDDFMGAPRTGAADVGAFERTGTPNTHLVGGGTARPPRVSTTSTVPATPTNLRLQ